jgi:hypothetical protein
MPRIHFGFPQELFPDRRNDRYHLHHWRSHVADNSYNHFAHYSEPYQYRMAGIDRLFPSRIHTQHRLYNLFLYRWGLYQLRSLYKILEQHLELSHDCRAHKKYHRHSELCLLHTERNNSDSQSGSFHYHIRHRILAYHPEPDQDHKYGKKDHLRHLFH